MDSYIFDAETFHRYYNCATAQYVTPLRYPSQILGVVFLGTFAIFETLYFPLLFILTLPFYRSKSCYKFMHTITCIDLLTMPINGALTGVFFIQGSTYCDYPWVNLYAGALVNVFWMGQSLLTVILALDRCLSMISPVYGNMLFGGARSYIWIVGDILYMIVLFLTTKSVFFNAAKGAWFFDPFLGHDYSYRNYVHTIHNTSIPILLGLFYLVFAASLLRKKLITSHSSQVSIAVYSEASVFSQVFIISAANFFVALSYDYAQFFDLPLAFVKASSYAWLLVHGFPSVLYITTNKKIQKDLLRFLGIGQFLHRLKKPNGIVFTSNSVVIPTINRK